MLKIFSVMKFAHAARSIRFFPPPRIAHTSCINAGSYSLVVPLVFNLPLNKECCPTQAQGKADDE
jgi:hypothetical protein